MGAVLVARRPGWTLPELMVSLTILGVVLGIAAHFAVNQLRFYRAARDAAERRGHLEEVGSIVSAIVSMVTVQAGGIVVAQDTALEVLTPIGAAIACASQSGSVVVPAAANARGNTFGAFVAQPELGDQMIALVEDSTSVHSMVFHITAAIAGTDGCSFASNAPTWALSTVESNPIPAGSALRIARPIRLSFYKSSDSKWYLGAKDWNGAAAQFNSVQPVIGPLNANNSDPKKSGFRFSYRDSASAELLPPFDTRSIASVVIVARAGNDSTTAVVALRNTR